MSFYPHYKTGRKMGKQTIAIGSVHLTGSEEAVQGFLKAAGISIKIFPGQGTYVENLTGLSFFVDHNQVTGLDGFRYYANRDKKNPGKLEVTRRRLPAKKDPKVEQPEESDLHG